MCEPVSLSIAAAAAVAGAGVSAYGQYQQGQYQSAVANQNARMANAAAADAEARGAEEQGLARMKGSELESHQEAGVGASGVDASGSASKLMEDSRLMNEFDVARIGNNAAREAYGYRVGGAQALAQGQLDSMRGTYGAAGSILGGIGNAASIGSQYLRNRAPDALPESTYSGSLRGAGGFTSGYASLGGGAGDFSLSTSRGIY